jgi:hypothetical protein
MKKILLTISIFVFFAACDMVKAPDFQGISKIDFKKKDNGKLVLVAYAKYHNPNLLGGKFQVKDIKVYVDDKYFADLNSETYKVPTKKDFEIPLEVDFDAKYFKKNNILDALNSLINNKLKVHYKGKIVYVSHGLNIPYQLDYEQEVKIAE